MIAAVLCALAAGEAELKFTKWEFARERVGHKVVAEAALFNGLETDLEELALIVVFYDRDLELKRSRTIAVPSLPAGKTVPVRVEVEQLPNFNRYQVFLAGGGGKWLFHGDDVLHPPTLKRKEPAKLDVLETRGAPGSAELTLVVRNTGEVAALEPTALISFDGAAPIRVRLAPSIDGASRDTFLVTLPDVPRWLSARSTVAWLTAEGPSQKDGDAKGVAIRRFRSGRLSDGSARVDGEIGNGGAEAVEKVVITFSVGPRSIKIPLPGILKAGETRLFEGYLPDCPAIDSVGYDVAFENAGKGAAPGPGPRAPSAKRLESKGIELAGPKLPPSAAPPREAAPAAGPSKPEIRIELRGLLVAEGFYNKANKYTGDVYFLRVAFLDAAGKTIKPDAEFQITLVDAKNNPWKIQRIVGKREWALDAAKVNNQTADAGTMACDKKTGELWIGLLRTDGGEFAYKAEIKAEIKGEGEWLWRAVDGKFQSAPRSPDSPAKK